MLPHDVRMHVLYGHLATLRDQETKTGAVEDRATPDHLLAAHAAQLPRHVGEHVDGIGHHQQDCIRGNTQYVRNELAADIGIGLCQVDSSLAGFLLGTCGHDHYVGTRQHRDIIGAFHFGHGHEHESMVQVEHLRLHLAGGHVEEADLLGDPAEHARVGNRCANAAGADDADLAATF